MGAIGQLVGMLFVVGIEIGRRHSNVILLHQFVDDYIVVLNEAVYYRRGAVHEWNFGQERRFFSELEGIDYLLHAIFEATAVAWVTGHQTLATGDAAPAFGIISAKHDQPVLGSGVSSDGGLNSVLTASATCARRRAANAFIEDRNRPSWADSLLLRIGS